MADKKVVVPANTAHTTVIKETTTKTTITKLPLFEKENYMWMGIGAAIIMLGMFLMSGGKNSSADQFDYKVVYSTTRITVAPILILLGLFVEIYAIFKRPRVHQQ